MFRARISPPQHPELAGWAECWVWNEPVDSAIRGRWFRCGTSGRNAAEQSHSHTKRLLAYGLAGTGLLALIAGFAVA